MVDRKILTKLARGQDLPTLPLATIQILEALGDDDVTLDRVAALASQDAGIAGRMLKIANSSFYNPMGAPTATLQDAIGRIGLTEVRNIVSSVGAVQAFQSNELPFDHIGFWTHCHTAALAAGALMDRSSHSSATPIQSSPFFMAGLFHDVGVFLLAATLGKKYARLLEKADVSDAPLAELEEEILGVTHTVAGAALLEVWGLPENVVNADWIPSLDEVAQQLTEAEIALGANTVAGTITALEANAMPRLALEVMALEMPSVSLKSGSVTAG